MMAVNPACYNGGRRRCRLKREDHVISVDDIEEARTVLKGVTVQTPLLPSDRLSQDAGGQIFIKAENTQRAGSFKLRGAYVKMASLSPAERERGVIAHSAGNHAQGMALAA